MSTLEVVLELVARQGASEELGGDVLRDCAFFQVVASPPLPRLAYSPIFSSHTLTLLGTQPRFTQVPPTSLPENTAVLRPWPRACNAAPWPPTPHPIIATSKSKHSADRDDERARGDFLWLNAGVKAEASEAAPAISSMNFIVRVSYPCRDWFWVCLGKTCSRARQGKLLGALLNITYTLCLTKTRIRLLTIDLCFVYQTLDGGATSQQ